MTCSLINKNLSNSVKCIQHPVNKHVVVFMFVFIVQMCVMKHLLTCVCCVFLVQDGFCRFFSSTDHVSYDSSMKTALFAAAGVGLAGLTFLLVR